MDIATIHQSFLKCSSVSIDTRKILPNALFVAIKGPNFDAHTFVENALEQGALYAIIDNEEYYVDKRTILVSDSLTALQQLANFHREYLAIPIIGLTGSNGKTTTKELINAVLSQKYRTGATAGNLNNHLGVPLTLLSFMKETEIGIVEMGANHQGEIAALSEIAEPDYGYITNFGKAHLEGFGGVEGVIKGKSELYQYLKAHRKLVFVNMDDPLQSLHAADINAYTFGVNNYDADLNVESVQANPLVSIVVDGVTINSNLIGQYNAANINAAIAIGRYFEVSLDDIKTAIEGYVPENNRSQLLQKGTNEIILDAYNANPSSMAGAIQNFKQLKHQNKIAILGDMFELGSESFEEHRQVVNLFDDLDDIHVYFVGADFMSNKIEKANTHFFKTFDELSGYLKSIAIQDCMILIKGSRGMQLERLLEFL